MSKHDSFFSPTTAPLLMVFKRPTTGPRSGKVRIIGATLIEAPHPQEVNYLAGKEALSSVLINYLWRYNYREYGINLCPKVRGHVQNYF